MASVAAADATYGIFLSSPALAEAVPAGAAQFGLQIVNDGAFTLTANIAVARDATDEAGRSELDGCSPLTNTPDLAGRIALIQRGTCNFSVKASNAQNAGAIAVIIDDNVASQPVAGMGGVDPTVTIPAVRITLSNGQILRAALGAGTVIGTISTRPVVPPSITLPADIVVETSDPAGIAVSFDVTGHTELGASTPSCRVSVTFVTSPSVFPPGATTVICSVGDPWGHSAGGSFTVTVLPSEAPVFVARPPVVAEATGPSGAIVVFELPAATDNVGVTSVECDRASGSLFPLGASTVTCTASDAAGNVGQGTFEVRVLDTTAPTITFAGNGTYTVDQTVSITCTATDLVTASPSVTCPGGSGPAYGFDVGANTVTATARDEAGNTSTLSTSFVVNVTVGGICNLVKSWSPFATTTSSLCQALDAIAGELSPAKRAFLVRAFIFFVERQSGKTIPADRAAILIRLARAL